MTALTRGPAGGRLRSCWVWLLGAIVLVGIAFPVGLRVQAGGGPGASADSAAVVGAPAAAQPSPGMASRDSSEAGASTGAKAAPAAPQSASGAAADTPVVGPKIARSAWLGIKVSDLVGSSGTVRSLTAAAGGQVLSENVVTSPDPTGGPQLGAGSSVPPVGVDQAQLTVRVPAEKLDGLVAELSRIGTVSYRSSQSEDLTDSYVDTSARIGPMRDAVAQARALLAKATSLSQIIELENEVTRRQSELDSLQSRLATLERRTTTSDVTVNLWTSTTPAAPATTGFLARLEDAWTALLGSVAVIITGLAVLLPWLVVLLVAVLLGRRWWVRRPQAAASAAPGD